MSDRLRVIQDLDENRRGLLELWMAEAGLEAGVVLPARSAGSSGTEPAIAVSAEEMLSRLALARQGQAAAGLLIYIHVPFCASRCSFCDWVSDVPGKDLFGGPELRERYAEALCRQISFLGPRLGDLGYEPRLVYWGGGTPSRLESHQIRQVVACLHEAFDLSGVVEHTMEVSPDSVTPEKLEAARDCGVNRLSMGVQSFIDEELRSTGRAHSAAEAERAFEWIRAAGFENVNLDLIVALPDQRRDWLETSLRRAVELGPEHLTTYLYRPTPGTALARQLGKGQRRRLALEEIEGAYELTQAVLAAAGYEEYITNYFARDPKHYFRGEEYYFGFRGDYIGFGSGANSLVGHHLLSNHQAHLRAFLDQPLGFDSCERVSPERPERVLSAMREVFLTRRGIDFEGFRRAFGFDFQLLRGHPYLKSFLEYYRYCGAELVEEEGRLAVSEATRSTAYLRALTRAYRELEAVG